MAVKKTKKSNQKVKIMNKRIGQYRAVFQYCCLMIFLSSCASETTSVRYYKLGSGTISSMKTETVESKPVLNLADIPLIVIEPIRLADFLRQQGLVIQKSNHQLQISNIHRWAEDLTSASVRLIRSELENNRADYRFETQSGRWKTKPAFRLNIELEQFQINHNRQTVTSGQFWIFDENKILIVKRKFLIKEKLTKNGYEHAISNLELSLVKLSKIIVNSF